MCRLFGNYEKFETSYDQLQTTKSTAVCLQKKANMYRLFNQAFHLCFLLVLSMTYFMFYPITITWPQPISWHYLSNVQCLTLFLRLRRLELLTLIYMFSVADPSIRLPGQSCRGKGNVDSPRTWTKTLQALSRFSVYSDFLTYQLLCCFSKTSSHLFSCQGTQHLHVNHRMGSSAVHVPLSWLQIRPECDNWY